MARSANQSLTVKRIRRTLEPEQKTWNDELLEMPWDDIEPKPSQHTLFAMKNVFFFSHATAVQAATIARLQSPGHSAIVEAPTGCGKTLAFLVPVMERMVATCERHIAQFQRPILSRHVVAMCLSPSRVLAEQTFVVARNLAARFPHNIHVLLCDGVMERAEGVVERAMQASRGAGMLLVSTPGDAMDFFKAYHAAKAAAAAKRAQATTGARRSDDDQTGLVEVGKHDDISSELLEAQSEETRARYLKKLAARQQRQQDAGGPNNNNKAAVLQQHEATLQVRSFDTETPFFLVLDEADVILRAADMRNQVMQILNSEIIPQHRDVPQQQPAPSASEGSATSASKPSRGGKKPKGGQKRGRDADECEVEATVSQQAVTADACKARIDVCLCGATAGMSGDVTSFKSWISERTSTQFHDVLLRKAMDFTSQLTNQYVVCEADQLLQTLVHNLNLHPSKKHFVFFNSTPVLLFVKQLLQTLAKGTRPVLYVRHVYAMYDEMKESTRFAEYNGFLEHQPAAVAASRPKKAPDAPHGPPKSFAEEKNQVFSSGWKRDGAPPPGTGAVLLCTDLAAFGLDVRDVDYVYHFEPPATLQSYVHRIGRVGRMGMRGTSVLLLPTFVDGQRDGAASNSSAVRERKTTSLRFNTITNTKSATASVQSRVVTEADLTGHHEAYLKRLQSQHRMEVHTMPPNAPITPVIRSTILSDNHLVKLAKSAAMALCKRPRVLADNEDEGAAATEGTDTAATADDEAAASHSTAGTTATPASAATDGSSADEAGLGWFTPALAIAAVLLD